MLGCSSCIASLEDVVVHDTVMLCIQGGANLAIQVFFLFSGKPLGSDCRHAGLDSEAGKDTVGAQ